MSEVELKSAAEEAIRRLHMPPDVVGTSVDFGKDHDGDDALWIVLQVRDADRTRNESEIRGLTDAISEIQDAVLSLGGGRFPYVTIEQAA